MKQVAFVRSCSLVYPLCVGTRSPISPSLSSALEELSVLWQARSFDLGVTRALESAWIDLLK